MEEVYIVVDGNDEVDLFIKEQAHEVKKEMFKNIIIRKRID